MNFKKIFISSLCFLLFFTAAATASRRAAGQTRRVAFFGDAITLRNPDLFVNMLQLLLDHHYGENSVIVENYTFFDMNTSQVTSFFTNRRLRPDLAVILSGEANYFNLIGFYEYYRARTRNAAPRQIPQDTSLDAVITLNRQVRSVYRSKTAPAARSQTPLAAAFRAAVGLTERETFVPAVVPEFKLLDNPLYLENLNFITRIHFYNDAWNYIRRGEFGNALRVLSVFTAPDGVMDTTVYYMLGIIALNMGSYETALRHFKSGILLDPFDPDNLNYQGLVSVYMSFAGQLSADALFFARVLRQHTQDMIEAINAITSINVVDFEKKINTVNHWIKNDFQNIREVAARGGVPVLFLDYPKEVQANNPIHAFAQSHNVAFLSNQNVPSIDEVTINSWYMAIARNVFNKIRDSNLL